MKLGKTIGLAVVGALAVSLIPYYYRKDEQTGVTEIRSLLWGLKKTPHKEGETKDHYTFAMPPSALDKAPEGEPAPEEVPAEAPAAEEPAEASAVE